MTWTKTETRTFINDLDGRKAMTDWLFLTYLPAKGWTCSWSEEVSNDKFFAITRPLTLQDGSVQQISFVYKIEHADYDLLVKNWNGTDDYATWSALTTTNLILDSTWVPINESGDWDVWEDDASDAFMICKQKRPFAFQFPDGGWRPQPVNTFSSAGSRPKRCIPPVQDRDMTIALIEQGQQSHINCIVASDESYWNNGVWQDYTAMGVVTSSLGNQIVKIWEDVTNTWKMRAEALVKGFSAIEVVKIDSDYYIDIGPYLLPAGTVEPTI